MLFFKEHSVRNSHESKPVGRTLFVLNVPPYCTQDSLIRIFCKAGSVSKVYFQDKPSSGEREKADCKFFTPNLVEGFKVAYVIFKDSKSLKKAMAMKFEANILSSDEKPIKTGIEKWVNTYEDQFVEIKSLQTAVDEFMRHYDKTKAKEEKKLKANEGVPDDEGWITVTRE